ncbi:D-ribulokinase [Acrasis kona]|uniref:D-ribulokinase n=1 Tax=Acrasis kona TaxID=1008807 RepID=A0AAW2Z0N7_9EUKA
MPRYTVGVDVGSGSVRAAIVNVENGEILNESISTNEIKTWHDRTDFYEQSSRNIWECTCNVVKAAVQKVQKKNSNIQDEIVGIGFDATCSLVAVDLSGGTASISLDGRPETDIILWADHRANSQAEHINSLNHNVLQYVGGIISPEMETPKLLWIKQNLPDLYNNSNIHFFDLADYLVYKSTGQHDVRSECTTICKWTYSSNAVRDQTNGWDSTYFSSLGLDLLLSQNRIGTRILPMGQPVGNGLTKQSADAFNLRVNTPVAVSAIDAHAGGIGSVGASLPNVHGINVQDRIVIIAGTSSCHMAVSNAEVFVRGVWGPFYSAMIPGMWLSEGGQSAVGKLMDHVVQSHVYYPRLLEVSKNQNKHVFQLLNEKLDEMRGGGDVSLLSKSLHVLPYFHGNRSPLANPSCRGVISGLTISHSIEDLALLYLATIQAISYGTRHIIESINEAREKVGAEKVSRIIMCGGLSKNKLFVKMHSDVTQSTVYVPKESEAMIVGSAILGAVAGGAYQSVSEAMSKMNSVGDVVTPSDENIDYHRKKYLIYREMYEDHIKYERMMK